MRTDSIVKETYEKHSLYLTEIDGKPRFYYFEIENLEEDYAEARKILFKYENVSFDFVASCIKKDAVRLRVFSKEFTGRFSISKSIPLNTLKQKLEHEKRRVFANRREVWWSSFGINIGSEMCGKNDFFERPVVILKVFNKNTIKVIPLTTKKKTDIYHYEMNFNSITSYASLSQVKTISTKRLSRKMGRMNEEEFQKLLAAYKKSI